MRGRTGHRDAGHGDSIAVSGVCLTVVDRPTAAPHFTVDVMAETLKRTTIGTLEPATGSTWSDRSPPTTRLGGHIVQGHVDGVGTSIARTPHPDATTSSGSPCRADLARYSWPQGRDRASTGSRCTVIDGDRVTRCVDCVGIIPETRTATTIGDAAQPGDAPCNIEVDLMAKYVEGAPRVRAPRRHPLGPAGEMTGAGDTIEPAPIAARSPPGRAVERRRRRRTGRTRAT